MHTAKNCHSKVIAFILVVVLLFSISSCNGDSNNQDLSSTNHPSEGSQLKSVFQITVDNHCLTATHLNSFPQTNEIILYTRDFTVEGKLSLTLQNAHKNRTVIVVESDNSKLDFRYKIVAVEEKDCANIPIPYNGFALSVPTASLTDIRIRNGQEVAVVGAEILPTPERTDIGSIRPYADYGDLLTRRIHFIFTNIYSKFS